MFNHTSSNIHAFISQLTASALYSFLNWGILAARSWSNAKNTKSDIPSDTPAETPAERPADALVDKPPAEGCEVPGGVDGVGEDETCIVDGVTVGVSVGVLVCVKDVATQV